MNDADRQRWLDLLGEVCVRHNWLCRAYCLMDNQFHIVQREAYLLELTR